MWPQSVMRSPEARVLDRGAQHSSREPSAHPHISTHGCTTDRDHSGAVSPGFHFWPASLHPGITWGKEYLLGGGGGVRERNSLGFISSRQGFQLEVNITSFVSTGLWGKNYFII